MVDLAALPDEELIRRFQEGAEPAVRHPFLDELFGRHQKRVALWCLRMTGNQETALDLAQEVFMKAYQHLDKFRSDARFSTWLYSIARNHCLNHFKSQQRRPQETEDDSALLDFADLRAANPYSEVEMASEKLMAEQLLAETLDESERRVFVLHYVEDYPLDAITRLLGLTNPTGARAFLVTAKRKLKRAVEVRKARRPGSVD